MGFVITASVLGMLFVLVLIKSKAEYKKKAENRKKKFRENYGTGNERKFREGETELISHYSKGRETKETIDDLTWNDLDMDAVFEQMAYTGSSLGDDYLYYMLRNPVKEERILLEREKKILFFQKNPEIRIGLQNLYAEIGRIREYSFADYLNYLFHEEPKSNVTHYLSNLLIFGTFFIMCVSFIYGIIPFFSLVLYNIIVYFKYKADLELYLSSLRYLLKNLEYAKELFKLLPEEMEEEKEILEEILNSMKKIQRNSYLVMSPGRMAGEGFELILDYFRMCFHIDIIKFNRMLKQLQKNRTSIWKLYEIMGETDACIAIGQYRAFLPQAVCPVFHKKQEIYMKEVYHPLIQNAVANSLDMKKNVLLTGSNASGKSTFLKTVGINVLLAQTIHTCLAGTFELPFARLFTSMSLKDSLALQESYYMAEIKAIKRILDSAGDGNKVICMVDEVLRGTNTMERIAASTQILKTMSRKDIICIAATHDIELTKTLEKEYENYHFEETLNDSDIFFSYKLKKGRTQSCNAIRLLEQLGYDRKLTENAEIMVKKFKEQGEWMCE